MATITEIATYVCNKLENNDATSIARAVQFCISNYEDIWDARLWSETLKLTRQDVTGVSSVLADGGIVEINDFEIDLILAVSWDSKEIQAEERANIFRLDPELLTRVGTPERFSPLERSANGKAQIRLYEFPSETKEMVVLGKKVFPAVSGDSKIIIPGAVGALKKFVEAEMLERDQQREDGMAKNKQAFGNVALMESKEDKQRQRGARIIPDIGGDVAEWEFGIQ